MAFEEPSMSYKKTNDSSCKYRIQGPSPQTLQFCTTIKYLSVGLDEVGGCNSLLNAVKTAEPICHSLQPVGQLISIL